MRTISLKLPDSLFALLEKESRVRRIKKSTLICAALKRELSAKHIKDNPTCYDLARDLAGSVKGLPKDIITNPNYMQGFGL